MSIQTTSAWRAPSRCGTRGVVCLCHAYWTNKPIMPSLAPCPMSCDVTWTARVRSSWEDSRRAAQIQARASEHWLHKVRGGKEDPPSRKNDRATGKLKEKSNTACHPTNRARTQSLLRFSLFIICSFGIVEQDILFPCFEFHFDHIWIIIFWGVLINSGYFSTTTYCFPARILFCPPLNWPWAPVISLTVTTGLYWRITSWSAPGI